MRSCHDATQDTPCKVDPATVSTSPGEDASESSLSHNWQPTEGSLGHPELCNLSHIVIVMHGLDALAKMNKVTP